VPTSEVILEHADETLFGVVALFGAADEIKIT
jgi:hypothetical protein